MAKRNSGARSINPFSNRGSGSGSGSGRGNGKVKKYPPAPPPFDFEGYEAGKSAQFREEQLANIQRRRQEEINETQSTRGYAFTLNGKVVSEAKYLQDLRRKLTSRGSGSGAGAGKTNIGAGIANIEENIQGVPDYLRVGYSDSRKNGPKPILEPELPPTPSPISTKTSQSRPIDDSEIASKNPLLISNLTKQVFDKKKFQETVDVDFSQLGIENQVDPSFFDVNLATLEDFWTLYEQFFYDIPKEGDTNSHAYLARTSGEYANYEFIQEQIQELLDEIAEIRMENVELRIENVNTTVADAVAVTVTTASSLNADS